MVHVPVLLHESIDNLNLSEGKIFLDGTVGRGGHSALVAETFGDEVEIIALDKDPEAIQQSEERLRTLTHNAFFRQTGFEHLDEVLQGLGISKVDAILLDLGVSSPQIDDSGRGFSFQRNEPLLMTMAADERDFTAATILNTFDEEALELIIRGFGEEKYSRKIAREIVRRRETKPFETTFDLVEAVRAATPTAYHHGRIHPATRTFQALRIATNAELTVLEQVLPKAFEALNDGGRLAVISFHSLEDRMVKEFFRNEVVSGRGRAITKKPIVPTPEEIERNPRSRSAKLRIIEKLIN
jgi:16S rRNA (cytosine1402-N4)-methyltransferase